MIKMNEKSVPQTLAAKKSNKGASSFSYKVPKWSSDDESGVV